MSLIHYDPWALLEQMRNEINRLAESRETDEGSNVVATSDWVPPVDIVERDDAFVILADVPGVDPASIEINMENGVLSIKGERAGDNEDRKGYKRVERARGTFYRRFSLPDSADPERITARSRFGVLEITIPKLEKVQPRRINVEGE